MGVVSEQPIEVSRQAGAYVRRAREHQGLTRRRLAQMAGVSERLLASLELGDATGIRLDKLLMVFEALGLALLARGEGISSQKEAEEAQPALKAQPLRGDARVISRPRQHGNRTRQNRSDAELIQTPGGYDELLKGFIARQSGADLPEASEKERSRGVSKEGPEAAKECSRNECR